MSLKQRSAKLRRRFEPEIKRGKTNPQALKGRDKLAQGKALRGSDSNYLEFFHGALWVSTKVLDL